MATSTTPPTEAANAVPSWSRIARSSQARELTPSATARPAVRSAAIPAAAAHARTT